MGLCCNENTDLVESGKRVEKDIIVIIPMVLQVGETIVLQRDVDI